MPELVSDDDTDSEDESQPYKSMTELSILPAILHAFDPIQLFYEAVSAELDRYLGGPQPIIVYSTHTPQWSDTCDAQYFDMLRQFISSQQGRIRDHLPEYITTIDPDLSEDQNEERWWTHMSIMLLLPVFKISIIIIVFAVRVAFSNEPLCLFILFYFLLEL